MALRRRWESSRDEHRHSRVRAGFARRRVWHGQVDVCRCQVLPTEVISSHRARAWVTDDEGDQTITGDAFDRVHAVVDKRLKNRWFTGTARISMLQVQQSWNGSMAVMVALLSA